MTLVVYVFVVDVFVVNVATDGIYLSPEAKTRHRRLLPSPSFVAFLLQALFFLTRIL